MKKILIVALVSVLTLSSLSAAKPKKDIYLQLYSLRADIKHNFNETIKALGKLGYAGVEAASYDNGKFYGMSPVEFADALAENGMTALSSHVKKVLPDDITTTDWDEIWAWWETAIRAHKKAGMTYIVMPSMPKLDNLSDLKAYCNYYNEIGTRCNAEGLRFGYHNHAFEFVEIEGQLMYDYMLQNTDPNKVFFQMDVYWVVRGGKSPVDYFNAYPGRFEVLHIKDDKELGESGMVGFDAIFKNAAKAGLQHVVVEVEQYNLKPLESVKKSLKYLHKQSFVKKSYAKKRKGGKK